MRRFISILLLAVFGLPLALPILALGQSPEAGLPVCCRNNGKHHCMMSMNDRDKLASHDPQFRSPAEKCPYCPSLVAPAQSNPLVGPSTADAILGSLLSHPSGVAQTEYKRRISLDRSRQKRGPPAQITL